jgi:hypothetical protein
VTEAISTAIGRSRENHHQAVPPAAGDEKDEHEPPDPAPVGGGHWFSLELQRGKVLGEIGHWQIGRLED